MLPEIDFKNFKNFPTRAEARKNKSKFYFTGIPCKRGHVSVRYTVSCLCKICKSEIVKKYTSSENIKNKNKTRNREHRRKPKEQIKAIIYSREYRIKNPDYAKNYYHAHKAEALANVRLRQTRKTQACPLWANLKEIRKIYKQAKRLSNIIGIKYEVDHIVPIKNSLVCGLHIPANLQIIPKWQNATKSNKFKVD